MKFVKIDVNDIPEGMVLSTNCRGGFEYGKLEEIEGVVCCINNDNILKNITHYLFPEFVGYYNEPNCSKPKLNDQVKKEIKVKRRKLRKDIRRIMTKYSISDQDQSCLHASIRTYGYFRFLLED